MSFAVTNLVQAGDNTGAATVACAVPVGGVLTGSLIVVLITDRSVSVVGGSVADTKNTYTAPAGADLNGSTTNGFGAISYAYNTVALTSSDTITYTKALVAAAAVSIIYITGAATASDPRDSGAGTTTATGTGTALTATTGTPSAANDIFVGLAAGPGNNGAFTQDVTNGTWVTITQSRNGTTSTDANTRGGYQVMTDQLAHTYAPAMANSRVWAEVIMAFQLPSGASRPVKMAGYWGGFAGESGGFAG